MRPQCLGIRAVSARLDVGGLRFGDAHHRSLCLPCRCPYNR